eukprot:Pgem_evm1s14912
MSDSRSNSLVSTTSTLSGIGTKSEKETHDFNIHNADFNTDSINLLDAKRESKNSSYLRRFLIGSNFLTLCFYTTVSVMAIIVSAKMLYQYVNDVHSAFLGLSLSMVDASLSGLAITASKQGYPSYLQVQDKYNIVSPKVNNLIDELSMSYNSYDVVVVSNDILRSLEQKAFSLMHQGNFSAAESLLEGDNYTTTHDLFKTLIEDNTYDISNTIKGSVQESTNLFIVTIVFGGLFLLYTIPSLVYIVKTKRFWFAEIKSLLEEDDNITHDLLLK